MSDNGHDEPQDELEHDDECGCPACDWCQDLDADDLSLISQCTGVAALFLAMFGYPKWPHLLALPLGLVAIYCGFMGFKKKTTRDKQASAGMICGTIGLCIWVTWSAFAEFMMLLGRW